MPVLPLYITDAGRAAMIDPVGGGTRAVTIAQAGFTQTDFVAAPTLEVLPGEFKRVATVAGEAVAPDTVHLTLRDDSADTYALRGFALYLSDGTLFAVHGQSDTILEKTPFTSFFLAFDWTLAASDAAAITFGDTSFLNPPATQTVAGVLELASLAEALAGLVADKAITPATMGQTLAGYVRMSELGAAGGVATLGEDGKLALAQRPPIDLIDVWPVASEAQMLALPEATAGDFAVRSDNGLVYVLQHPPASDLANWLEISTPAPVSSVNGKVGAVALGAGDVGAVPAGRRVDTGGGLLGGGGTLTGDLTLTLTPASIEEANAGTAGDRVVTPASLSAILATLAGKASGGATVSAGGLLKGGNRIEANPALWLDAASPADIVAGTASDKAITPAALAGLPRSLTPNGWITLPGGLRLMWVQVRQTITTEASFTVVYPDSFSEFVVPLAVTGWNAVFSNTRNLWMALGGTPGLSSCQVQTQSYNTSEMRIDGFNLFLIGK
ncbi:MAG: hypothetical protein OC190_05985 [Novosphingobium aromaticivorans]|nr:hypothetical protein [Novosphingobium aromaticivorans]